MLAVPALLRRRSSVAWPPVLLAGLGGLGVAWGACHPEFAHHTGWPSDTVNGIGLLLPIPVNRIVIVLGVVALTAAWWLVRPGGDGPSGRPYRRTLCWLVAAAGAPMLGDRAWMADFARATSAALARPVVRVDVQSMTINY